MYDNFWCWLLGLPGNRNYEIEIEDQVIRFRAQKDVFGLFLLKMDGRWRYYGLSWDAETYELNYNKCYNWYFFKAEEIRQVVFRPR